jgi:hypothetical protein
MGNLGISLHSSRLGFNTTVNLLLTPLHAVMGFFALAHRRRTVVTVAQPTLAVAADRSVAAAFRTPATDHCPHRLRVLRVTDASCTAHSAGRMVISGRFSEVCAELDRLSQQEAA